MTNAQNLDDTFSSASSELNLSSDQLQPKDLPDNRTEETKTIRVSGYEMYVRRRQQRETAIFTWIGATMVGLLVVSLLVFFGLLPVPFFNSFKTEAQIARAGDLPCPLSKQPVSPQKITAKVINGTGTSGLAKEVAAGLKERQVEVKSIGNISTGKFEGDVRITTGPAGINAAYTLARAFQDAEIVLDPRPTNDVTVIVGSQFSEMLAAKEFAELAADPIEEREGCIPVSTD